MSLYEDIYNDYPLRCAEVWRSTKTIAQAGGREVTLMLMAATAGLATPWEHLKIQSGQARNSRDHPAFKGFSEVAYQHTLKNVAKALALLVSHSPLFVGTDCSRWYYGHAATISLIRNMVELIEPQSLPVRDLTSRQVISVLRNALAHNNLYAFGGASSSEISQLVFFAEHLDRNAKTKTVLWHDVLSMPVCDFEVILDNWFGMLEQVAVANRAANRPAGATLKLVISRALEDGDARATA